MHIYYITFFGSFWVGIGWFEKVDESSLPSKTSKRNFKMLSIPFFVFSVPIGKTNRNLLRQCTFTILLFLQVFELELVGLKKLMNRLCHQKLQKETSKCWAFLSLFFSIPIGKTNRCLQQGHRHLLFWLSLQLFKFKLDCFEKSTRRGCHQKL